MRYTQDSGVKRRDRSPACEEYRVVVSVYLTPEERDLWGSGQVELILRRKLLTGSHPRQDGATFPLHD